MSTLKTLRAARDRISKPENWTKHYLGKTQFGLGVSGDDERAVCWCALGALEAEGANPWTGEAVDYLKEGCVQLFGNRNVAKMNNELGHAAALRMYDAAIAAAEAEAC